MSATFRFISSGGEQCAHRLAQEWCRRMQHLYDAFQEAGGQCDWVRVIDSFQLDQASFYSVFFFMWRVDQVIQVSFFIRWHLHVDRLVFIRWHLHVDRLVFIRWQLKSCAYLF